ncbi:tumor necrosis factor receptor superfamily member 11A isoform X2 [Xenopus laevis]|nr:tumor necrosis factor receptor superfamily member 11A isoform X2 [Xenopus laevis]
MTSKCTASKNTTCIPCGPNEYMPSWNDDYKCFSHQICDSGKALKVAFNGNRTSPRKCICEEGYHFSDDYEFCNKNTKCALGYVVVYPVQLNADTKCKACPVGYFSNSSSLNESCQPWTNCSKSGLFESKPGSNHSDVVCDHLNTNWQNVVIFIVLSLVVALIVFTPIYFLCCTNHLKDLKENLEQWLNVLCHRFQETEKKSPYNVNMRTNNYGQGHQNSTSYVVVSIKTDCAEVHEDPKQQSGTIETSCVREHEVKQRRSGPIENEYLERKTVNAMETGQLIDGSACVSDTEDNSAESETFSYFPTGPDHPLHLQQDACGQSARELTGKQTNSNYVNCSITEPTYSMNGYCPLLFSWQTNDSPSMASSEETASQSSGCSGGSTPTSETPPLSGQVTGNNNTTVISNGSVMNIKADVLLLVLSPTSQDAPTVPDSNDGNMGKPVQEENQCHFDSFVANTENHADKYTQYSEELSYLSQDTEAWTSITDFIQGSGSSPILSQELNNIPPCQIFHLSPVQEEGKPE